jgi:hypothetical protein
MVEGLVSLEHRSPLEVSLWIEGRTATVANASFLLGQKVKVIVREAELGLIVAFEADVLDQAVAADVKAVGIAVFIVFDVKLGRFQFQVFGVIEKDGVVR